MYVTVKQQRIFVKMCVSFKDRFKGLMGKRDIDMCYCFPKCRSIHTFFMKEPITVIMTDKNNKIVKILPNLSPWKMAFGPHTVTTIYEFPASWENVFKIGEFINIEKRQ